jgi:hypothetical protein
MKIDKKKEKEEEMELEKLLSDKKIQDILPMPIEKSNQNIPSFFFQNLFLKIMLRKNWKMLR